MKYTLLLLLLPVLLLTASVPVSPAAESCPMGMSLAEMAVMSQQDPPEGVQPPEGIEPPEGNPSHQEPTEICRPNTENHPCLCLKWAPEGCKEGHREVEHRSCMSWCFKRFCGCCSS